MTDTKDNDQKEVLQTVAGGNEASKKAKKEKAKGLEIITEGPIKTEGVLLTCKGIDKLFSGVQVLFSADFEMNYGEVHALMGENGAGKSTLIKIVTGVYHKDAGQLFLDEEPVEIANPIEARAHGISVIYQELSLVPDLTVMENIYLGQELTKTGFMEKKRMRDRTIDLIKKYDLDLSPDATVEVLSMAQRQMVEVLKALSTNAKLIIMDEPTSTLSASEAEHLFKTIEGLKKKGTGIIYVTHRLEEVYRIADRLTVMRNGEVVGTLTKEDINPKTVTTMMIGREIKTEKTAKSIINPDLTLEVKSLKYGDILKDINFTARGGEILGIGGLVGSGRTELIHCIYGAKKASAGSITLNGKPVSKSIIKNINNGFGLVPEDRRLEGFNPLQTVEKNIAISSYDVLANSLGIVSAKKERDWAEKAISDYDIRPTNRKMIVENMSGGNQQKVILSRWLVREPRVLILDEPTVGVDVGVRAELYRFMRKLAESGSIIIMVSSDLFELVQVSDRILVMHDGKFFEEFDGEKATQTAVLLAASGEHSEEGIALC
ncbi:MAG: sugar ABC transporter ATP-binding protein [Clostridiales Family XIII bacterium]|jgi:ribose transport system ATP-binding protein|nr:sugar ABC transporter ATP-binding protein [Clostridiales Family XIII bacterium]